MVRGCGSLKKCPHPLIKPRSLVLWHYVTAWGFFYVLSPCNTPKQQMPKRPKLRINTRVLSEGDGSECYPVRVTVRWWRHGEDVMRDSGSEGMERKAGPEDDVQRTCHFSTKSRSISLSLHNVIPIISIDIKCIIIAGSIRAVCYYSVYQGDNNLITIEGICIARWLPWQYSSDKAANHYLAIQMAG